jgi:hypothetical protein
MTLFFSIARIIRAAYKALRAAVGIMIVAHGTYKWVQAKRAA